MEKNSILSLFKSWQELSALPTMLPPLAKNSDIYSAFNAMIVILKMKDNTWAKRYKTFYGRNLRFFVMS
jgi:hypothetical protein